MEDMAFKSWAVGEGIIAIQCPGHSPGPGRLPGWGYVLCYLVIGGQRALLLDTGYGNADLKGYVEMLTDLPVMVANSHVHPDHAAGNCQFDLVYVGENEVDTEEGYVFPEYLRIFPWCREVLQNNSYRFAFLKDGEVVDLGGRELTVVEIPGHTRGSIVFFDHQTRLLLSGDAILKRVLYSAGIPFSQYRKGLEKAKALAPENIVSAHWPQPLGMDFVDKMLALLDAFDPAQSEPAAWNMPDAPPLRMFCRGRDFDDPDFVAISFSVEQLEQIMR